MDFSGLQFDLTSSQAANVYKKPSPRKDFQPTKENQQPRRKRFDEIHNKLKLSFGDNPISKSPKKVKPTITVKPLLASSKVNTPTGVEEVAMESFQIVNAVAIESLPKGIPTPPPPPAVTGVPSQPRPQEPKLMKATLIQNEEAQKTSSTQSSKFKNIARIMTCALMVLSLIACAVGTVYELPPVTIGSIVVGSLSTLAMISNEIYHRCARK